MPALLYTSTDLIASLRRQFPNWYVQGPCVMNNGYVAASRSWVDARFSTYIWQFQQARGQLVWNKRGNQCEHFALRAALEAVDLLHQMPEGSVPADAESLAIACCKYQRGAGTASPVWHEVNLWLHDGTWNPWEPQTRTYFQFTEAERLTAQQFIIP